MSIQFWSKFTLHSLVLFPLVENMNLVKILLLASLIRQKKHHQTNWEENGNKTIPAGRMNRHLRLFFFVLLLPVSFNICSHFEFIRIFVVFKKYFRLFFSSSLVCFVLPWPTAVQTYDSSP